MQNVTLHESSEPLLEEAIIQDGIAVKCGIGVWALKVNEDRQLNSRLKGSVAFGTVGCPDFFEVDRMTIRVSRKVLWLLARHHKLIELFRSEHHFLETNDVRVQLVQVLF